tara:strand:- start:62 stop:301 length:240 start_codon:yes stop_codon:yes gene_type:complete
VEPLQKKLLLLMMNMITKEKQRAQVKSRFYYIFWGVATVSVVLGQVYVGSGYRMFARSLNRIFDTIEVQVNNTPYERFY